LDGLPYRAGECGLVGYVPSEQNVLRGSPHEQGPLRTGGVAQPARHHDAIPPADDHRTAPATAPEHCDLAARRQTQRPPTFERAAGDREQRHPPGALDRHDRERPPPRTADVLVVVEEPWQGQLRPQLGEPVRSESRHHATCLGHTAATKPRTSVNRAPDSYRLRMGRSPSERVGGGSTPGLSWRATRNNPRSPTLFGLREATGRRSTVMPVSSRTRPRYLRAR
jgi:hypothetical protein